MCLSVIYCWWQLLKHLHSHLSKFSISDMCTLLFIFLFNVISIQHLGHGVGLSPRLFNYLLLCLFIVDSLYESCLTKLCYFIYWLPVLLICASQLCAVCVVCHRRPVNTWHNWCFPPPPPPSLPLLHPSRSLPVFDIRGGERKKNIRWSWRSRTSPSVGKAREKVSFSLFSLSHSTPSWL